MRKILSFLLAFCLLFITLSPFADASVRVRRGLRNTQTTPYMPYYQQPTYQTPYYQIPQVYPTNFAYPTTVGNTYYFSPNYIAGYTYYQTPNPGYYYYSSTPTPQVNNSTNIQYGQYYYSANYIQGYTYYQTPTAGYYYYLPTNPVAQTYSLPQTTQYNNNNNLICTIINNVYQCTTSSYGPLYSTYPGCSTPDIIIGGQVWASCNSLDRNAGSTAKSGWFFAGDRESSFTSYNGSNSALEWMGKQTRESSWNIGPCATGYRLPNRGEWEVVQSYARANNTTIAGLLSLQQNGAYQAARNTNGDITLTNRLSVIAAYWTSSVDGGVPVVMHIGSSYAGYNTNGTDYGYVNSGYQWSYTDTGLQLIRSTTGELANVRCIRQ